ncbi:hypothetical protein SAMN04488027_102244 [Psychroflexus sediminis]|uniref:Uncharacterized protein n=1 Tax=Psychroflexus sediminis TaxID=470826 RepID=A0A1G7URN7_9FLAO|nr:hypothetical protein SAMN04488027_102244 [Psychroflexus sediminis]
MLGTHTIYKLWLGLYSLGKTCGFPEAGFYLERFVPRHATAHIHNVAHNAEKTEKLS